MTCYIIDSNVITLHTFVVAAFGSCLSWPAAAAAAAAIDTGMYEPATFCNWGAGLKCKCINNLNYII